jgi:hypothetical protein
MWHLCGGRTQEREFPGLSVTAGPDLKRTIAPRPWMFKRRTWEITRGQMDRRTSGATSEAGVSSVANGPSRAAVCHINHAARCGYLFAMLRRSNDGNQRGSLLRSTRPGPLIGGSAYPPFSAYVGTLQRCDEHEMLQRLRLVYTWSWSVLLRIEALRGPSEQPSSKFCIRRANHLISATRMVNGGPSRTPHPRVGGRGTDITSRPTNPRTRVLVISRISG